MPQLKSQPKTVLVVEDDPGTRAVLVSVLESAGYRVLQAGDGEEALRQARQHFPDRIVLDLVLPGRSGFEVLRELQTTAEIRRMRVVIVSGSPRSRQEHRIGRAVPVLSKPFDVEELLRAVGQAPAA